MNDSASSNSPTDSDRSVENKETKKATGLYKRTLSDSLENTTVTSPIGGAAIDQPLLGTPNSQLGTGK
jgi:hypothetical protein